MGTQQSKQVNPPSQWEWIQNENGVEIYRNREDGRIAERRRVTLAGAYTLAEQKKVYSFRSINPYGLVKSYEVIRSQDSQKQKEKISDLCKCGGEINQLDVYTERIQYRLSELPQLTFPESLFILKQATTAFDVAYAKVGGFHINPQLIGITEKGQVRAWVNQNWALNGPSHFIPLLKSSSSRESLDVIAPQLRDQSEMINNLISVVSQKTQKGRFPQQFSEQLKTKATNFRTLKKYLNDYLAINNITLPQTIKKNKIALYSSNNIGPQPVRSEAYTNAGSVSSFPQQQPLQNSFQAPKFSFNSTPYQQNNANSQSLYKHETSLTSFEYKPSSALPYSYSSQPSLTFSNYASKYPASQSAQIKETVSTYKYYPETNNPGDILKPVFSDLKFNLFNQKQPESRPAQSTNGITKAENPLFTLNQAAHNDAEDTHHNASYKILAQRTNSIET